MNNKLNPLLSFHNKQSIKNKFLKRIKKHMKLDNIIKGTGWKNGKGCAIGCTLENYDHSRFPIELGLPKWFAILEDNIFEGLENKEAKTWPYECLNAIPIGINFEIVRHKLAIMRMNRLYKIQKNSLYLDKNQILTVIKIVKNYHKTALTTIDKETIESARSAAESAARSAAWSAESAAWSAESAAWSARYAARSAAWSAAESARSAARSAAESAESAAWSAESAAWSAAESAAESARSAAESAAWSARYAAWSAEYTAEKKAVLKVLKEISKKNTKKNLAVELKQCLKEEKLARKNKTKKVKDFIKHTD